MTDKADRIKRLLEDEDLKSAFESVRTKLVNAFTTCSSNDVELMVDVRKRLNLLDAVEQDLKTAIQGGKLEDFRATEKERPPFLGDIAKWRKKLKQ